MQVCHVIIHISKIESTSVACCLSTTLILFSENVTFLPSCYFLIQLAKTHHGLSSDMPLKIDAQYWWEVSWQSQLVSYMNAALGVGSTIIGSQNCNKQSYPSCYNKNMKEDTWHLFQDITEPKIEYLRSTHAVASSEMTYIVTKLSIFDCEPFNRRAWVRAIPY